MSDDGAPTTPAKRGRKAAAPAEKVEKVASKRTKKDVAKDDEGSSPAKRGRGRPKGTAKKSRGFAKKPAAAKSAGAGTGRRGRPAKKKEEEVSDEDGEENDAEEEDDE